jgi:hypothetical protein
LHHSGITAGIPASPNITGKFLHHFASQQSFVHYFVIKVYIPASLFIAVYIPAAHWRNSGTILRYSNPS